MIITTTKSDLFSVVLIRIGMADIFVIIIVRLHISASNITAMC